MPIYSPTGFLDITNATLRTSNVEAENLLMTGGNIYVTSELETDATVLNLENVTRKGNVSSNTIEITNATTGIVAAGNVHALKFIGSGSHLTGIPPSAITGTLSQWSDGNNNDVYIASNVGIANAHTLTSNTLQVGGNLYVRDTGSNVLTVNGNVVANYFEGDGSKLSGIVTDLQGVTDNGNVTTNVVQFSNATTGLVTTANIEVGGDLKIDGLTAGKVPYVAADKFLKDSFITTTGDATVISSNLDVTGNIFMRGNKFIVESETKLINDAIIGIANNNTSSTTDKGIIMQSPSSATTGNVAIIHHGAGGGFANQLTFGYTDDPLDTVTVTNDLTKELTVNVLGNVITQNNLSIGGLLKINTISAASSHSLQAVTNLGNVTSNTVQFSNAITSLVASSNIVATGNVSAGYDTNTTSYFGRAAVGYMGTSGQASFAHVDHNDPARYAIKQTAAGPTYINTPAAGHIRFTVNDGNAGAEKMRITSAGKVGVGVTSPDATLHVVGNAYVSSNLTVSGNVEVGTANLFVNTVNSRIGVGTTSPDKRLHVYTGAGEGNTQLHLQSADRYSTIQMLDDTGAILFGNDRGAMRFITGYDTSLSGGSEAMRIAGNGNVGIGTTNPATKLHLYDTTNEPIIALQHLSGTENNTSTNVLGNLALHYSARSGGYPSVGIRSIRRASTWDDQADMEFYVRNGGHGEQTAMVINSASTSGGAKVGINTTNPLGKLDIRQGGNVSMGGTTQQLSDPAPGLTLTSSSVKWAIFINTNDDLIFTSHNSLSGNYVGVTGYILEGAYDQRMNDFTGQHRCFLAGVKASEIVNKTGLIVCANKNQYTMISNKTLTGQEAIDVSESIPNVSISHKAYDKTCFGVISDVEDPEKREDVYGVWGCPFPKENGDDRVYINSVGEGAIWVTNINGPLESGDYITTSNVAGYGQKQDSEFLANYTVAKITMDCDFEPATQPVQVIKKDEEGENILDEYGQIQWEDDPSGATEKAYKIRYLDADGNITYEANAVHVAAFVGCTYHCG